MLREVLAGKNQLGSAEQRLQRRRLYCSWWCISLPGNSSVHQQRRSGSSASQHRGRRRQRQWRSRAQTRRVLSCFISDLQNVTWMIPAGQGQEPSRTLADGAGSSANCASVPPSGKTAFLSQKRIQQEDKTCSNIDLEKFCSAFQ